MISIIVESQADVLDLRPILNGIDTIIRRNPTRQEVLQLLRENPNDRVMFAGHGTKFGLFSHTGGYLLTQEDADMLRGREVIGIWCYANEYAKACGLYGFFTSMFVSNPSECVCLGFGNVDREIISHETQLFAEGVNALLKQNAPLDEWVEKLYMQGNIGRNFVNFNLSALTYINESHEIFTPMGKGNEEDNFNLADEINIYWDEEVNTSPNQIHPTITYEEFAAMAAHFYELGVKSAGNCISC